MNTYEHDILDALKTGPMTNRELRLVFKEVIPSHELVSGSPQLDTVLRKLRMSGQVEYIEKAWRLSGNIVCSLCNGTGRVRSKQ